MSSEVKRFNPDALGDMRANLAGEYVSATDYDTVSAELREFKNGNTMSLLRAGFAKACEERDAARAQLAAIQGGMGEVVEVVAWRVTGAGGLTVTPEQPRWAECDPRLCIEPLMTVAQHQRIAAAMAAEVEVLHERNDALARDLALCAVERERFRAELAEVKGREAACFVVGKLEKTAVIAPPLPVGTKLYALPPASPDVEGLVKALTKAVAALDQLLPYLGKIPADVGLLNDALVAARPLLEQNTNKEVTPDGK